MFRGRVSSWNLRDGHMAETLEALLAISTSREVGARSSFGSTTPILAMLAPPPWATAASGTSASLSRERFGGGSGPGGFHHLSGHGNRRFG